MARVFHLLSSPPQSPPITSTPHRTSIPTENHTALFMPARIAHPDLRGTTMKAVCVPRNSGDTRGLPASTIVLDEDTGAVKAIVNARNLTALRNAAGSLLSTNLVGIHAPTSITTFGAGKQIEAHLVLHIRSFPSLTTCTLVNRSLNARVHDLRNRLAAHFPHVTFAAIAYSYSTAAKKSSQGVEVEAAVRAASLVICATSSTMPLFAAAWVSPGTHVILIGSYTPAMREVERTLVRQAVKSHGLLVDSREACAVEAGELIDAGVTSEEVREIGEFVAIGEGGEVTLMPLRKAQGSNSITMFKSVGVGLQDVAIACAVVEKADSMSFGSRILGYDFV
ncbi:hypothetical protein H0H81_001651 [Sphagnurus paluster]|uniref:NAD(P)-binding protein n=1 Tax=Sphagnurus paluster TaxID=117069 RepID=A0A9P7FMD9_9AGAR|nr:hypothetical protein H0H81_001651 [Sphagnurus paluster]